MLRCQNELPPLQSMILRSVTLQCLKKINIVVMHPEDTGHHNYVSPWTADVHVPHVTQAEIFIIGIDNSTAFTTDDAKAA